MAGKLDCKKTHNSDISVAKFCHFVGKKGQATLKKGFFWKKKPKFAKFIIKKSPDFYHTNCSIPSILGSSG